MWFGSMIRHRTYPYLIKAMELCYKIRMKFTILLRNCCYTNTYTPRVLLTFLLSICRGHCLQQKKQQRYKTLNKTIA